MNKELVSAVAEGAGISQKDATTAVKTLLGFIGTSLKNNKEVGFKGFGKFYLQRREERKGRNPKTKQPLIVKARNIPKFKAGRDLKAEVR